MTHFEAVVMLVDEHLETCKQCLVHPNGTCEEALRLMNAIPQASAEDDYVDPNR